MPPTWSSPTARRRCRPFGAIGAGRSASAGGTAAAVADRHRDLARAATVVAGSLGPDAGPGAVRTVRRRPDPRRLDWWALADQLTGDAGPGRARPVNVDRRPGRHLALVGPTASGKSAVALVLAARAEPAAGAPTEIVSCDSMQVYRGMDIGTAKPTAAERAVVPHHLIDLVEPTEEHNLRRFLDAADRGPRRHRGPRRRRAARGGYRPVRPGARRRLPAPAALPGARRRLEAETDTEALALHVWASSTR